MAHYVTWGSGALQSPSQVSEDGAQLHGPQWCGCEMQDASRHDTVARLQHHKL